jgi:quercetin dioxygenase-like cupin family protein
MRTEDAGIFVGPDDGKSLPNPVGGRMVVKVRDEYTAGAYSIHDNTIPAGAPGPRPHIHRHHEEAFYVLEGELTVRVGPRTIIAPAGSFVVVPRGIVHQPSNPGAQPTRFLLIFSPAGMDHFFEEAAEGHIPLQAAPTDTAILEELEAFTERYGLRFAEFPQGS